ncbi:MULTISPECIES: integrase arm-type DNA-binding domain-containing protein [Aggregatibacter]|mgnify:CR=1 FL=1|uniref:integrase arm-type DNA-binding domain-containing protein n=1 Tax=Aggregatibacter TaxID=416916 RepID=UPI001E2C0C49|nr:integrase arm-type DNA-binding domain-containing protein [Aggregatibacter sp. Marseille-P9115]
MQGTKIEIRKSKRKSKEYTLSDNGGLILRIKPTRAKLWIFNYYHPITKKRDKLGLGSDPELSLADVRYKHEEYRRLLANNIDPRTYEAQAKQESAAKQNRTYWH